MKKLAIFDLDGTLVDSVYDLADSANNVLRKNGYPAHDTDRYYYFVGNGTRKLIERALPEDKRSDEEIERVHSQFLEEYSRNFLNRTRLYDGIFEAVKELSESGVKCAVASNKTDVFTRELIEHFFGKGVFSDVVGKRDGVPTKPDPAIVNGILKRLSVSKEQAIFIGDSNVDIKTGQNAGLETVGCTWGFRTREELEAAGADYIIDKPSELFKIIRNS